jgi:hypothetical protein
VAPKPETSAAGELSWSAWPARDRPLAAIVVVGAAVVLGVLVGQGTNDAVLAVAAPAFVLLSVSSWLLPTAYRLTEESLEDLSAEYGISRERVRQIEVRAFEKLQKAMKSAEFDRRINGRPPANVGGQPSAA